MAVGPVLSWSVALLLEREIGRNAVWNWQSGAHHSKRCHAHANNGMTQFLYLFNDLAVRPRGSSHVKVIVAVAVASRGLGTEAQEVADRSVNLLDFFFGAGKCGCNRRSRGNDRTCCWSHSCCRRRRSAGCCCCCCCPPEGVRPSWEPSSLL